MSVGGEYTLWLDCDSENCGECEQYVAPTRMHAKEKARIAGWKIPREGRVLCPDHRKQESER